MFEREKLSGNNFNDWFRQLNLVLRVEKKLFVIEQPLPAASAVDFKGQALAQWNSVYDTYNEVAYLILGSMTHELHRQFENCHISSAAETRECDIKIHIAQDTRSYHTFVYKSLQFRNLGNVKPLSFNKPPNVLILVPNTPQLPLLTTHLKMILENVNNDVGELVGLTLNQKLCQSFKQWTIVQYDNEYMQITHDLASLLIM
ncbi:hypothetical protein Tco_0551091 [Tanacetum coccineum]